MSHNDFSLDFEVIDPDAYQLSASMASAVAQINTCVLVGIEACRIQVEVDLAGGLPGLTIVGLPDAAVSESKERVRAALRNSGYTFPAKRVVVNLAPADMRKEGTGFDLPVALGVLLANNTVVAPDWLSGTFWIGELALEGSLRPIQGALAMAMLAKKLGFSGIVVPQENAAEAALVEGIAVYGLSHLRDVPVLLLHPQSFWHEASPTKLPVTPAQTPYGIDFADVKGQAITKRALEIAAAGGHNILLFGPPGSGKSMLSKAFMGILPPLSTSEALEVSQIYSVAGLLPTKHALMQHRPFRSPHHSASMAGMTGGGSWPKPGEITLAHRGVLFLDEFVEFPRPVLEVLRQPLEDGQVTISRAQQSLTFPARFQLIAAMNPCPCGFRGDSQRACSCSPTAMARYVSKLSGPLLDRIDLHLEVPRLPSDELLGLQATSTTPTLETSEHIRQRVIAARKRQKQRLKTVACNADMTPAMLVQHGQLTPAAQQLMKTAMDRFNLSARSVNRLLRVARTISDLTADLAPNADIGDTPPIDTPQLAEALQYRAFDRLYQR